MPIADPGLYRAMIDAAARGGYAVPAINVSSSSTLNAALRGFADAGSDGIVQVTTGGAAFAAGPARDMAVGAKALAYHAGEVAARLPVLVALHTDHCTPDALDGFVRPLLAESRARRARGGEPLFGSHMFDGSGLPLAENLAVAAPLLAECASLDVLLEVECGVVGGAEDGARGEDGEGLYTTPQDLLRVAEALGTGERGRYLVAATFGTIHGIRAGARPALRPEILAEGQTALAARHGPDARFAYVVHGSSGTDPAALRAAIEYGAVKVNVDTDAQYAYSRPVADHMLTRYAEVLRVDGGVGDKAAYDPRAWGRAAEEGMAARVSEACRLLGSAGRSLGAGAGVGVGR
jgi:fructose-bisphosphate aldolase, class II